MATGERFGSIFEGSSAVGLNPTQLLRRFAESRDEAAFSALVAHHGPMVLATCRRILPDGADADDAFQATFLVLARKAKAIHDPDRLAPWLHGVARRVAVRSRSLSARRRKVETENQGEVAVAPPPDDAGEIREVLDEELARLPEKYRVPLVLCYLEGLTHDEAADQLRWPVGTVRSRLAGARDRLRFRLARRGFAPGALVVLSPSSVPMAVLSRTLQVATVRLVFTGASGKVASTAAALLAQGVLTSMFLTKVQTIAVATLTVATTLAAGTAGVVAQQDPTPPQATRPTTSRFNQNAYNQEIDSRKNLKDKESSIIRRMEQTQFGLADLGTQLAATREQLRLVERGIKELVVTEAATPSPAPTNPQPAPSNPAQAEFPPNEQPALANSNQPTRGTTDLAKELAAAKERIKALEAEVASLKAPKPSEMDRMMAAMMGGRAVPPPPPVPNVPDQPEAPPVPPAPPNGLSADLPSPPAPPNNKRAGADLRADPLSTPMLSEAQKALFSGPATQPLSGGRVLYCPAERDRVTIIDSASGTTSTFKDPGNIKQIVPLTSSNMVGLELEGPNVTEVVALNPVTNTWLRQKLREPLINGKVRPVVGQGMVYYYVGRSIYALGSQTTHWGVLDLKQLPLPDKFLFRMGMTADSIIVPEDDMIHVFNSKTGEWTHVNTKDDK